MAYRIAHVDRSVYMNKATRPPLEQEDDHDYDNSNHCEASGSTVHR